MTMMMTCENHGRYSLVIYDEEAEERDEDVVCPLCTANKKIASLKRKATKYDKQTKVHLIQQENGVFSGKTK